MVNDSVENNIVVAERPKDASFGLSSNPSAPPNPRARTTILTGRIKHDCFLRPAFSARYRKQMRERHRKYNTPVRQIQMIEQAGIAGGRGGINRLSSGVGVGAGSAFSNLVVRLFLCHFGFALLRCSRQRTRGQLKEPLNVWHVCPGINSSTHSLLYSANFLAGVSRFCEKRLNSPRLIWRRFFQKLLSCIVAENTMAYGRSKTLSRRKGYAYHPTFCTGSPANMHLD